MEWEWEKVARSVSLEKAPDGMDVRELEWRPFKIKKNVVLYKLCGKIRQTLES